MTKAEKLFIAFAILLLLIFALICIVRPNTCFLGAAWRPWVLGAAVAWAVGKFLDELLPSLRT